MADTNSYADTYRPISDIQKIATETGIPIVLIHHTRKGGNNSNGEGWADEGMGSQGINSAVDTIILLQKKDGLNEGSMRVKGRDIEERKFSVVFDRDICTWRITGECDISVKTEPAARAELIAVLEKAGPEGMRTGEIEDALGKSNNAVCNTIKILQDKGRVFGVSRGRYILSQFHESSLMNVSECVNTGQKGSSHIHIPLGEVNS